MLIYPISIAGGVMLCAIILAPYFSPPGTSACLEAPMFQLQRSPLIINLKGMYESSHYTSNVIWRDATETLKVPAAGVLRAAEYHFNTSRDLLGGLEGIQQWMEEVDQDIEAALRIRDKYEWQTTWNKLQHGEAHSKTKGKTRQAAKAQDALDRQIANASYQLSAAESMLGGIISDAASARERDGTAVKEAEDQLAFALASTDNIAGQGDYGIGVLENRMSRLRRMNFLPWLGFSRVHVNAWPKMRANSAEDYVGHAREAGRKLLEALKQWGPLNQVIKDDWNRIDSWRKGLGWNSEPAHVRLVIAALLRVLQEYQDNLDKEINLFMETWGGMAGYVWERVEQDSRVARACAPEVESPDEAFESWVEH